jgi:hypothetical protein
MNNRYKIDERSGCAAVIDTFYPNDSNCLDSDSVHVVKYMHLPYSFDTEKSEIRKERMDKLEKECKELNEKNTVTKEQCDEALSNFRIASDKLEELFPRIYRIGIN